MPTNLENQAVAAGLEKVSFHSNPKEKEMQKGKMVEEALQIAKKKKEKLKAKDKRKDIPI